jgi:energy-coupling factor transporter ATP-binding protein EcfA2
LLNDINFKLVRGRIGLIYGPSGSGKSTLLNVLAGFANEFDGDVRKEKRGAQGEGNIGVVFQFPERYFVGNTIIEELSFGWRHSNKLEVRSEFVSRLQPVLRVTGLEHMQLDKKLSELSGGYQRRVAIAVQLLRKPSVLLLDEPTAGMDLPSISTLCETLELVKETSTVLVVSHDTEMLSQIADDVWEMKVGGILVQEQR